MSEKPIIVERIEGESNWEWCERMAKAQPSELIIGKLLDYIDKVERRKHDKQPLWSKVGYALGHGSGVSQAIVALYTLKD